MPAGVPAIVPSTLGGPEALPVVLLVTEDPVTAEQLRNEAERRGLIVAVVDFKSAAATELLAAVVVDTSWPAGLEVLARLRAQHGQVPLLALGGDGSMPDRLAVAEHGVVAYLDHAVTPTEVVDALALTLERRADAAERVLAVGTNAGARLAAEGMDVETVAADGLWEALAQVDPALLVVGSADLCAVVRADRGWATVPIIAVAGDAEAAFAAGADDWALPDGDLILRARGHLRRSRAARALAQSDRLTGLGNRRNATSILGRLLRISERLEQPLCLGVIEPDDPELGNEHLSRLGALMRGNFRGEDVLCRWGPRTFVVGMFAISRETGCDRLLELQAAFRTATGQGFSAGVAQYPTDGKDLGALYDAAGEALSSARAFGGDQVMSAGGGSHRTTQQVEVAIVDDEDATASAIARDLTAHGHRVWRFSNGAGAIEMLAGSPPAVRARVILLGLHLPAVSGIEVLTLLSRDGVLRSSKVFVTMPGPDPDAVSQVTGLGAEGTFVKPLDLPAIVAMVDRALGREDSG